jgi:hypothetical protein
MVRIRGVTLLSFLRGITRGLTEAQGTLSATFTLIPIQYLYTQYASVKQGKTILG